MTDWADEPTVDTRTKLKPSTYRQLVGHARVRGITVAVLLSRLADASIVGVTEIPPEPGRAEKTTLDATQKEDVVNRYESGVTQALIAAEYGVSRGYVSKIVRQAREAA